MESSIMPSYSVEQIKLHVTKHVRMEKEKPCVCGTCVICTNAPKNSLPTHIQKEGKKVEAGGLSELNRKDISIFGQSWRFWAHDVHDCCKFDRRGK